MAARARRLARGSFDRQTLDALTEFAQELEARAAALEPAPETFSHDAAAAVQRIEDDIAATVYRGPADSGRTGEQEPL